MFCKKCGQLVTDEANHVCYAQNTPETSMPQTENATKAQFTNSLVSVDKNKLIQIFLNEDENYVHHLSQSLLTNLAFWGSFGSQILILSDKRLYFSGKMLSSGKLVDGSVVQEIASIKSFGKIKRQKPFLMILAILFLILSLLGGSLPGEFRGAMGGFLISTIVFGILYFMSIKTELFICNSSSEILFDIKQYKADEIEKFLRILVKELDKNK